MNRRARIINGKCSNCGHSIIRQYKKDPTKEYYAINIVHDDKTTFGICEKCRTEIELPLRLFSFKYIIKKVSGEVEGHDIIP